MIRIDVVSLFRVLADHRVECILVGSVAALAWHPGPAPYTPGDLDIVPVRSPENLLRVAQALRDLAARPVPGLDWAQALSPEASRAWRPEPATEENLDHLFDTRRGRLDVVPRRAGLYEDLIGRCAVLDVAGIPVRVAHPEDLAATLRPRKAKHQARGALMETIRARAARGEGPVGLPL